MKKQILSILLLLSLFASGCALFNQQKLETGGAYAASETQAAMPELYAIDSSFDLAYTALDTAFKYEKANRTALWAINPMIKKRMDALRVEAQRVNIDFAVARQTYLANPVPGNLSTLNQVLGKLQAANAVALTVIQMKGAN